MNDSFVFSWASLENDLHRALLAGYSFQTLEEWYDETNSSKKSERLQFCLRVDIDLYPEKVDPLLAMLSRLGIRATFFIRLHSTSYNPLSFACLNLINHIRQDGHEVGLHHEAVDFSMMVPCASNNPLQRQLEIFEAIFGFRPKGVAGHGGATGLNNQDVFKKSSASDFELLYEAYDQTEKGILTKSRYVSDSLWTEWKSYDQGKLRIGDSRPLAKHIDELPPLLYVLIHPDTFYHDYPYENFR
jgi:hypothetical protein